MRARYLGHIVPLLGEDLVRESFAHLGQALSATSHAVEAFCNLAPRLAADLDGAALSFVDKRLIRIGLGFDAAALDALVPRLAKCYARQALGIAERVENPRDRASALCAVLPLLEDSDRSAVLETALLLAI